MWRNNDLVSYRDHGSPNWAGISSNEIPPLDNSLVTLTACSTCSTVNSNTFCQNALRQGAIGVVGAVSVAFLGGESDSVLINKIYTDNENLGSAFREGFEYSGSNYQYALLGDPTLKINPTYLLEKEVVIE